MELVSLIIRCYIYIYVLAQKHICKPVLKHKENQCYGILIRVLPLFCGTPRAYSEGQTLQNVAILIILTKALRSCRCFWKMNNIYFSKWAISAQDRLTF